MFEGRDADALLFFEGCSCYNAVRGLQCLSAQRRRAQVAKRPSLRARNDGRSSSPDRPRLIVVRDDKLIPMADGAKDGVTDGDVTDGDQ